MKIRRVTVLAGLATVALGTAACARTVDGAGDTSLRPTGRSTHDFPTGSATAARPSSASAPASAPASSSGGGSAAHPPPSAPLKSVTVHAPDGITYAVQIWADVRNATCADHAYGKPMISFLTQHPCRGMERFLGTTEVGGRGVGFAESVTSFAGTPTDPYKWAGAFKTLVEKDGTGSINDLLREGYRLPSGPADVPSPDAFSCLGQDSGVTVWDVWYLDGPTPDNDPALVRMTQDVFLQF